MIWVPLDQSWVQDLAMTQRKRSAEQQVADEADRKAQNPVGARQTIADSHADPEFQENYKRLRAKRLARDAELKSKN
jgi:hypothetical protein